MTDKKSEQQLIAVHDDAVRDFERIQSALRDERLQNLQDRRFYSIAGAQWEGPLGDQFENKPKFEVNKIHLAVIRIINEYRNNRVDVEFVSKDGSGSDKFADACASLLRADEQDSCAEEAYDNGFEEAVGGGFGAWRLRNTYEDEEDDENDHQRIIIEPIFDADSSVFFDLDAKRQDKSDAKRCYVISSMTVEDYKDTYDDDPATWPKSIHQKQFDWHTQDLVYVCEHYRIEDVPETIHIFQGLDGTEKRVKDSDFENDESLKETLAATGFRQIRERKIKRKRVHKYILSGAKILEDCGIIAGRNIPIVPVYGKRWFVDSVERCMGHVRLSKDAQRLKNMQLSKLGEISALSSIEKPIFTPEQISSHQNMWADDNIENYPYLLINPLIDGNGNTTAVGPVAYTKAPDIPAAMAALLQLTEQDMQDLLGNQQAGEQLMPNVSGKAVELIQGKLDMQTFIYISNFAKAKKRTGEIWLSMAKDIYVEPGRKMKGVGAQSQVSQIQLNKPIAGEDGEINYENDFDSADMDVSVSVGPSSESKRQSTVQKLTGMMNITQDPETLQILSSMAMMNMDGEGVSDVRDYFRKKLLRQGAIKPTNEEAQELAQEQQNTPQDPNDLFLRASAEQAAAAAKKSQADTLLAVAKSKESEAKTVETLAGVDIAHRDQILKTVQALGDHAQSGGEMPQQSPAQAVSDRPL